MRRVTCAEIKMNIAQHFLIGLIRGYQYFLSPLVGNQCRFTPTCSQYAREAIEIHGAMKGTWYAVRRVLRCHPWHPGGHDPVP